ncbi:PC4 and SFRS1-interacting protein [Musca vetustissima]|uniref:PC4 and SFRS1-interacting protein n=1 Tax=Musca vetustissima TaxID=27455 RepID=UPI002AB662BD|nr:PC4 and SFRS1-interacting protein [Musca vetustissima]
MVKEKKQFNIGDLVFAKVKGYPAWPAKITRYNNKKYNVYFYGTGETANIKLEDLFQYKENKEKFATDKNMKRNNFREAMEQIEAALNGEDSAPIDLPAVVAAAAGNVDTTIDSSQLEGQFDNTMDESAAAVNDTTVGGGVDDSQMEEAKEEDEPVAKDKEETSAAETTATVPESEVVSRSGRKIKLKRYIDDDVDAGGISHAPAAKKKVPAEGIAAHETKTKSDKKNSSSAKPVATITPTVKNSSGKNEFLNNLLLAFVPPAKCVGIKLDYQKPETFETPEEKEKWEENALKEAEELKTKLEMGTIKLDSVWDRVVVNPSRSKIHPDAVNRFTSQLIEQEDALIIERDFIQLSAQLRECLGLKRADVDRCLKIIKQYKEFQLTKVMLLRNPDCVDSIRRMRRYIGNLKLWNLSEEEEADFKAKAEIIRSEAVLIYNNFKKIFGPSTSTHFWEEFYNQAQAYAENTKHMNNRIILSEEHYKTLSGNKNSTKSSKSKGKKTDVKSEQDDEIPSTDADDATKQEQHEEEEDGEATTKAIDVDENHHTTTTTAAVEAN